MRAHGEARPTMTDAARRAGTIQQTLALLSSAGAVEMGIGPATIKSKSKLVQPSTRIGYLYNVEPSGLFPKEQADSSSAVGGLGSLRSGRFA